MPENRVACSTCWISTSIEGISPGTTIPCPACGESIYVDYPTTLDFFISRLDELAGFQFGIQRLQAAYKAVIIRRYQQRKQSCPETWLPVAHPLFGQRYLVSDWGRVRHKDSKKLLTPVVEGDYLRVRLSCDKNKKTVSIHVLVWEAFEGQKPKGSEIDHIDGVKSNPALNNLRLLPPGGASGNQAQRHKFRRQWDY